MTSPKPKDLMNLLIENGFIIHGEPNQFTLSSGRKSSTYVNIKELIGHPNIMYIATQLICDMLPSLSTPVAICGAPIGAIPIASCVSLVSRHPGMILRKERKDYGTGRLVEACDYITSNHLPVVLLEDVVTTGGSVIKAVNQLREEGFHVSQVITLVSRATEKDEEKIQQQLGHGCQFCSVIRIDTT